MASLSVPVEEELYRARKRIKFGLPKEEEKNS